MKLIAGVLLVAGLVLGAGYPLYLDRFSGKPVMSSDVLNHEAGELQRFSVELDPAMSPVQLTLAADVKPRDRGSWSHSYRATLSLDRKPVVQQTVLLSISEPDTTKVYSLSETFARFDVPSAGRYEFSLAEGARGVKTRPQGLTVTVRRNAHAANRTVMYAGWGMLALGVLLGVVSGGAEPLKRDDD